MNEFDSPHLDGLYKKYKIEDTSLKPGIQGVRIALNDNPDVHIMGYYDSATRTGHIESIEGSRQGHELMILYLMEMYASKVNNISLDARTKDSDIITQDELVNFYRRFGFMPKHVSLGGDGVNMEGVEWSSVIRQVQKYIERKTMPQT